jgi:hypothetical protein
MAKLHADKATPCISHAKFSPKDIERLETRVEALKNANEFDDENHAYIETASQIALEASEHKTRLLKALQDEDSHGVPPEKSAVEAAPTATVPTATVPTATVPTATVPTAAEKPKFQKAPKAGDKPAPKPRSAVEQAVDRLPKFDNIAELADAVAAENGLTPRHANIYTEHAFFQRSFGKIADDLGIGKSTVEDAYKKIKPFMDANSRRLESGSHVSRAADDRVKALAEQETQDGEETAAPEAAAPDQVAGEEDAPTEQEVAPAEVKTTGDLEDEDNVGQGQETRSEETDTDSNINIESGGHGKGKTSAGNNIGKARAETLAARWNGLNSGEHTNDKVEWKNLGSAQQDAFDAAVRSGSAATIKKAFVQISASANDGMRYHPNRGSGLGTVYTGTTKERVTAVNDARAKFPAVANARAETVGIDGSDVVLRPLSVNLGADTAAALHDLTKKGANEGQGFFTHAISGLGSIVTFRAEPGTENDKADGWFDPSNNVLAMNAKGVVKGGSMPDSHEVAMSSVVAHELVHAADNAAAQEYDAGEFLSGGIGSKTALDVFLDHNEELDTSMGTVMDEVMNYYQDHFDEFDGLAQDSKPADPGVYLMMYRLSYPLEKAFAQIQQLSYLSGEKRLRSYEKGYPGLVAAMTQASIELGPVLVQLRMEVPKLLQKHLPGAHSHAGEILAATSHAEVAAAILEKEAYDQLVQDQAYLAATRGSAGQTQQVRGNVRPHAGREEVGISARPKDAGRPVDSDRQAGARTQAAGAATRADSGLNTPPPLGELGKLKAWFKSQVSDKLYRNHPGVLGWFSTEQLASSFPALKAAELYSHVMQHMGGAATHMMNASDAIVREWHQVKKALGAPAAANFDALLNESTRTQVWPNLPLDDARQKHLDRTDPKVIAAHASLAAQWAATPKAYQELFEKTQADHRARFDRYVAGQRAMIVQSNYPAAGASAAVPTRELIDQAAKLNKSAREAFLNEHATSKVASDTYRSLFDGLDAQEPISQLVGPYAPQARFGDHIVHYKSPEFLRAEQNLAAATAEMQHLHEANTYAPIADLDSSIALDTGKLKRSTDPTRIAQLSQDIADAKRERDILVKPFDHAKELLTKRTEELNALKSDVNAYNVEFFENRGQATTREAQLNAFFGDDGTKVTRTLRDQYITSTDAITPAYIKQIEAHLTSSLSGADAQEVRRTVREMYLQHLPGTSALKSQIKRKNVPGVKDADSLRSFSNKAMRDAYAISRIEHGPALAEHLATLRNSEDEDSKIVGNELAKRVAQNFTLQSNKAISMATNGTYMMTLGLSPGFMLQQAAQQWVITAPIMAARHGMAAVSALKKGTVDASKLLKVSFNDAKDKMHFGVDIAAGIKAGIITADEGAMLKDMFDRGRIDITTAHDLGIASAGRESGALARATAMANWPVQQLEVINRISTALAGFRAENAAGVKGGLEVHDAHQRAVKYADKLVSETHMNYNSENRARFIHPNNWGGWGRVMFQFRAYQQGMGYLVIKNLVDGLRGDKQAMKAVGYLAGVQFATAGMAGMPIPGAMVAMAALLYKSWGDDDEDKDLKEMFFQGLKSVGGEAFARGVASGIPAALGVNVSAKLGSGNIFDVAPFVDDRKEGRDMVAAYWMASTAGAAGGQVANFAEAIKQAKAGDYAKAATFMLPKVAADVMRATNYQTEGLRDSRGNTILHPDDISTAESAMKAFGLQPEDISRTYDQRTGFFAARQARNDARAKLIADYARTKIDGGDVSDLREKIAGFNSRHPDDRIAPGALPVAVQKRREFERNLRNGVPVGKRDRALAEEVGVTQ